MVLRSSTIHIFIGPTLTYLFLRFYKLRVLGGQGDHPLHVSIPARCLVAPGNKETFVAVTSYTGDLIGISYDMSQVRALKMQMSLELFS
jgi:hypothetical protein